MACCERPIICIVLLESYTLMALIYTNNLRKLVEC